MSSIRTHLQSFFARVVGESPRHNAVCNCGFCRVPVANVTLPSRSVRTLHDGDELYEDWDEPYTPAENFSPETSMQIVITRPIPAALVNSLKSGGHDVLIPTEDNPQATAAILQAGRNAHGVITFPTDKVDVAFLDARPNLRAVSQFAVGFNNIDVPACTKRRIGASNTPGVLTDATAEVAWLLIMMAARRGGEGERVVRSKTWKGWGPQEFIGVDVVGGTLGIIGAGRIGSRLAQMAEGFDMPLLYHNRSPRPEMDRLGARLVPLDDLLKQSDFISIHVPLSEQTKHLIGPRELGLMKPTAVLVNTARGPVVDEAALVDALKAGKLFAAGLDVYEQEPTVHPGLFELENAVLLPHIGSATATTRRKMGELAVNNMLAMLAGKRPPHPLNPELFP
jgi:glyoxylate reductase